MIMCFVCVCVLHVCVRVGAPTNIEVCRSYCGASHDRMFCACMCIACVCTLFVYVYCMCMYVVCICVLHVYVRWNPTNAEVCRSCCAYSLWPCVWCVHLCCMYVCTCSACMCGAR